MAVTVTTVLECHEAQLQTQADATCRQERPLELRCHSFDMPMTNCHVSDADTIPSATPTAIAESFPESCISTVSKQLALILVRQVVPLYRRTYRLTLSLVLGRVAHLAGLCALMRKLS